MSKKPGIAILATLLTVSVVANIFLGYMWWDASQPNVLAVVNEDTITTDFLVERILSRNKETQLNAIIEEILVEQEAKAVGVTVLENDVTKRLQEIKEALGGDDLYLRFLTDANVSEADLKDSIRHNLYIEKIILNQVPIDETAIVTYYESNKDLFQTPELRLVRHIFTISEADAKKAYAELARGEDFGSVAERYSVDPGTNQEGGLIGYMSIEDQWVGVTDVAFQLAKGTYSQPIKSDYGWHVVYVEDIREESNPEFSEIKDQVEQAYVDYLVSVYSEEMLQALKTNSNIKINI
ncbi:MAG: peptidyl-prolyl cis-trans isomerase [Firmicutes bacterium]|nr:peptidyl-prolyl cis-trans isomerase [Bacillota bacterium]MDD4263445.1 peptidyl-prolyl cis-trans isomerase [Bacillota bacterium]MDD4692882.1 peptidyl-prolyl cis-trans isomerase [Bacillota bacterium]